jgi:hypothetical protein
MQFGRKKTSIQKKSIGKNPFVREKTRWIHSIKMDQNKLAVGM